MPEPEEVVPETVTRALGETFERVADPSPPPEALGAYRILRRIGQGAMGEVFLAHDAVLDRPCALKLPLPDATKSGEARFLREARAVARLAHPHIVQFYAAGMVDGRPYLAMEWVDGANLAEEARAGRVSRGDAVRIVAQVASGLAYAHAQGVIHRDIKPSNILVDREGHARLSDFGLAKLPQGGASLTRSRSCLGTIAFMAPEQARDAGKADARADVYGLGAVLYWLLTGRPPHVGETDVNVLSSLLVEEPPPPRTLDPEIPAQLEAICLRALQRDPARRFAGAGEFERALAAHRRRRRSPGGARRRRWAQGLAAAGLVLMGLGGWLLARDTEAPRIEFVPGAVHQNAIEVELRVRDPSPPLRLWRGLQELPLQDGVIRLKLGIEQLHQGIELTAADAHGHRRSESFRRPLLLLRDLRRWEAARPEDQDREIGHVAGLLNANAGPGAAPFRQLATQTHRCGARAQRLGAFEHRASGSVLHLIPGGSYAMGIASPKREFEAWRVMWQPPAGSKSAKLERWQFHWEAPQHEVHVAPFLIGRAEVQRREWRRVAGAAPEWGFMGDSRPELPLTGVSRDGIQAWLDEAGGGLRLPSEAEWEFAARAGTTTRFYWGDTMDGAYCRYSGNRTEVWRPWSALAGTRPNAFGLLNMLGNVAELCADFWQEDYRDGPVDQAPRAGDGRYPVLRGGAFDHPPFFCRVTSRSRREVRDEPSRHGFRVARSVD